MTSIINKLFKKKSSNGDSNGDIKIKANIVNFKRDVDEKIVFQLNQDEKEVDTKYITKFVDINQQFFQTKEPLEILQSSPGMLDAYYIGSHSLIHAITRAYNQHHHLIIRPDDIWIAIVSQFSIYINKNAEKLRDKFVSFEGKKELEVSAGGSLKTAPYDELTLRMSIETSKNIKDASIKDWIIPSFSTTTETDKIVGCVALMSSLQKYFDYNYSLSCGIPRVTMMGTVNDWKSIKKKIKKTI
ncbi:hypothetical protein DLAC_08379 [Tieghemostelium lacteum]|uniref:Uncharacterized protein n=1 Tax=Tieghemostelium lacteum TaxID=361077 RepID=A0A151ZBW9_TIELA|nr:hypothetical protein DLAC_08379 [Tieghemostelium lacteum]|eukprot:KYQ91415.1 hypothetical protein DLAC_08379 [Tieghemostelium lacteum]